MQRSHDGYVALAKIGVGRCIESPDVQPLGDCCGFPQPVEQTSTRGHETGEHGAQGRVRRTLVSRIGGTPRWVNTEDSLV